MTGRPDDRAFRYVHCDIPAGMTIAQWRAARTEARDIRPSWPRVARRRAAAAVAQLKAVRLSVPHCGREARV